ncbi:hypothetical protein C1645_765795 [Glomus cerebriforme]|uniref:Uncharacterized protein n=1 Tax=Glomus cerebriforme TaxID=658196 RepID=A0A397T1I8_9GLOM|nr:hypothetical protein C1645_765795 [Glomus cerebriforme]
MASILLPECLEKIFMNLFNPSNPIFSNSIETCEIKDLYSCTLVSRYWCQISTPLLYSNPFHYFRHLVNNKNNKKIQTGKDFQDYYKLIRTLLSCVPRSEIEEIVNSVCGKELFTESTESVVSPIFNYVKFIHELHLDDKFFLNHGKEIWIPSYISVKEISEEMFTSIINHLAKFLCENCNNLTRLEILYSKLQFDPMKSLTKDKLNGLKKLYLTGPGKVGNEKESNNLTQLYTTLSTTTLYLELIHNSEIISPEHANALSSLISSQKRLKHIILSDDLKVYLTNHRVSEWYNVVFNSLTIQGEWLERLELIFISFENINEETLNSLCSLKSLKELKLERCKFLRVNLLRSWVESLTNLKVIEYKAYSPIYFSFDFELLTEILKSSSSNLNKLVIDYTRTNDQGFGLVKNILTYSQFLTHLELTQIFPAELKNIFKSCTELVYFGIILAYYGGWEPSLRHIGNSVPNSVQRIQFKDMHVLEITSETLKYFLEGCVNSGGELRCLEITGKCVLSQDYFDAAKQSEVQLIKL